MLICLTVTAQLKQFISRGQDNQCVPMLHVIKITSVVQTDTVISASFSTGFLQGWLGVSSDENLSADFICRHLLM